MASSLITRTTADILILCIAGIVADGAAPSFYFFTFYFFTFTLFAACA